MSSKMFSSLALPNYRRYFVGVLVSNIGMWMATTARSWLVLMNLTDGDAKALGWLTGINFLPMLLLVPVAGLVADRFPKRRILLMTQTSSAINAALLATLVLSGHVQLWHVFLLAFIDGCTGAIDMPARQAFVSELVPPRGLSNAISLNSASFNAARLLGPGVAGALIALVDTGPVFVINACTFLVIIAALLKLDLSQLNSAPTAGRKRGQIKEGIAYVRHRADIVLLMTIAFVMGTFGFNFAITNALMATEVFGKGAGEYGMLGSVMGAGALAAALLSARRPRPRLRYVLVALVGFSFFSLLSAAAPSYIVFAALMVPIGLCAITVMVTANSLVQISTDAQVRGRVMALWGALLLGGTPIVSPIVGWIGDALGARAAGLVSVISTPLVAAGALSKVGLNDHTRIRLDRERPAPWLYLERGRVTEEVEERTR